MKLYSVPVFLFLLLSSTLTAVAQQNLLDLSFNGNGFTRTDFSLSHDQCNAMALQADGRIVLAGIANLSGQICGALARYLPDGRPDSSFGTAGRVTTTAGGTQTHFNAVAVLPTGKIIAVGEKNTGGSSSNYDILVVRYLSDGTVDSTFGANGMFIQSFGSYYEYGNSLALQPDGKILIGGTTNYYGSRECPMVVRLTANGAADASFGTGGLVFVYALDPGLGNSRGLAVACGTDGKITLAGSANISSSIHYLLYRFNADGSPDGAFHGDGRNIYDLGGGFESAVDLMLLPDNRPLVLGYDAGIPAMITVAQFGNDGMPDPGFAVPAGSVKKIRPEDLFARKIVRHPAGDYLIAANIRDSMFGNFTAGVFAIGSLGNTDSAWAINGLFRSLIDTAATSTEASSILVQPDGRILLAGTTVIGGKSDFFVARLRPARLSVSDTKTVSLTCSVYPNPTTGSKLHMVYELKNGIGPVIIELLDAQGRMIVSKKAMAQGAGKHQDVFALPEGLADGVYLLCISNGTQVARQRVVYKR